METEAADIVQQQVQKATSRVLFEKISKSWHERYAVMWPVNTVGTGGSIKGCLLETKLHLSMKTLTRVLIIIFIYDLGKTEYVDK